MNAPSRGTVATVATAAGTVIPFSGSSPPAVLAGSPADAPVRWAEVGACLGDLTRSDRRTLLLLARLPLLTVEAIAGIEGLRSAGTVYRRVQRLRSAGFVHALPARLPAAPAFTAARSGHVPDLLYLSDAGLAAVALDQGTELVPLAVRNRLRRHTILALVPGLPHLAAAYGLLAALAAAGAAAGARWPCLLAWERPWRRRFVPLTAATPVRVQLPAYAALQWGSHAAAYVFVPDLATMPLTALQPVVFRLFDYRTTQAHRGRGHLFPTLVVATTDAGRAHAWTALLEEARAARSDAPLPAHVTTWQDVRSDPAWAEQCGLRTESPSPSSVGGALVQRLCLPRLTAPEPGSRVPSLVGPPLVRLPATASSSLQTRALRHAVRQGHVSTRAGTLAPQVLGAMALALTVGDRELLDLIGRHPFLTAPQLASVLGKPVTWVHSRRRRLEGLDFLRRVPAAELTTHDADLARNTLLEVTTAGLLVVAAQQGLTLAQAVRRNGLAGGGPEQPIGQRRGLVATLRHTVGANGMFAGLFETARRRVREGHDDAVLEWRSAAACTSGRLRPDGYGVYRCDGIAHGFFLEYDRSTMKGRDYRRKFASYYAFLDTERYCREYDACPTLLVITTDGAAAARISRAALALGVGRTRTLRLLLTRERRLRRHPSMAPAPDGLLGPIWDAPGDDRCGQPPWPVR